MSSFLDELGDLMVSEGVVAEAAMKTNVLPPDPDNVVALIGLPGSFVGPQRDVRELTFPRWQAVVRNTDADSGDAQLKAVRDFLHNKCNFMLPHYRVLRIHAEQDGGPIGKDGQGRSEFSINFLAEYHYVDGA